MSVVPAGAWDCHAHVIEPERFPLAPGHAYTPPHAPLESYLALLDRYGFAHGVLVQPSVYGSDNRCLLDALDRADGRLFGIVVPPRDARPSDLEAMHERGARGIRCNLLYRDALPMEVMEAWVPVMRELGWHIEFHANITELDLASILERFDVPVVIDHMGRSLESGPLLDAVRAGRCYVKLSAPYRVTPSPVPWADVTPVARTFAEASAAACLWASDWPHTHITETIRMEELLAALEEWCPDPGIRRTILTESPAALYRPL